MADSNPPSGQEKKPSKKGLDWAALGAAVIGLIGATSAYIRSKTEPQAQAAYETLVVQVMQAHDDSARNHEDLQKLREYIAEHDRQQDEKFLAFINTMDSASTPQPPPPGSVKLTVKRPKIAPPASAAPPPTILPLPKKADRVELDKDFKAQAAKHDSAL